MTTQDYKSAVSKLKQFSKEAYEFRKSVGCATFDELCEELEENMHRRMCRLIIDACKIDIGSFHKVSEPLSKPSTL